MAGFQFRVGDLLRIEGVGSAADVKIVNLHSDVIWVSGFAMADTQSGQEVVVWLVREDALYRFIGQLRGAELVGETLVTGFRCVSVPERVQRRTEFRTPCMVDVTIISEDDEDKITCRSYDISSGGIGILDVQSKPEYIIERKAPTTMGIETQKPYEEGEKINCTFTIEGDKYFTKAIVRRCYPFGDGTRYRIGAQFIDMDYRDAKKLQKSIFKMQVKQR